MYLGVKKVPLLTSGLKSDLECIACEGCSCFEDAAENWGNIIQRYSAGVIPASTTISSAIETLKSELLVDFQSDNAASSMETAFLNFATTVASGMSPAFVGTQPIGSIGFADLFLLKPETHSEGAQNFADAIDMWMKTGTAVPSTGGAVINWS